MAVVGLSPLFNGYQVFDNNGNMAAGALLYTQVAGSTQGTPQPTYTTITGSVQNANPIVADSTGRFNTEIWLDSTLSYQFVLKTAAGSTIGTWNNINAVGTGIVENVATNLFTATAGQTVINLATVGESYTPNTNSIAVYRNGLRLITGEDFTESSSTTITLTTAAVAGDQFLISSSANINPQTIPSSTVTYSQGNINAITRTVTSKLQEAVSVKDFGAYGDGVHDDTAAIKSAMTAAGSGALYFPIGTYLCMGQLGSAACSFIGENRGNTVITYSGTAAPFITFGSAKYSGITFQYSNSGLTGDFTVSTVASEFSNCYFGSVGSITTAASCLDINGSTGIKADHCWFTNAQIGIQGQKSGSFATVVNLNGCTFGGYVTSAIADGGQGWTISGCAFEPNTSGQVIALTTTAGLQWEGLSITGSWFGDVTSSIAVAMLQLAVVGANITGNYFAGANASHTVLQFVGTSQGVNFVGNSVNSFLFMIYIGAETTTDIVSLGNYIAGVTHDYYYTSTLSGGTILQLYGDQNATFFLNPVVGNTFLVSTLPASSSVPANTRAFVVDANSTTFGSIVAGGGINYMPVFNDGTNWRIG